ncbi:MAG TPA: hypothetical protein VFQ13_18335 [Anaerolineales bacterium]|nr:hypothetical protein [Anaerolineales bacterium]
MQNEPIEVTIKVTDVLEKLDIPYIIGGSLASTLYGMVRTTQDSDVIAEMHSEHIHPFITALQDEFFIDEEMIADAVHHNSSFNIIHRETMFKVDIFIPKPRPFQKSQFARSQRQTFDLEPRVSANFASAEDTILSKLEWYRMGNEVSERQWRDILGVLKIREGELDLDYLHKWAKNLKVDDLLERALKESS